MALRDFSGNKQHAASAEQSFVVQKHNSTHLKYDLHLEHRGALVSWAVARGPSLTAGETRLALKSEDKPLAFAYYDGFQSDIDEYGESVAWDKGSYTLLQDRKPIKGKRETELQFAHALLAGKLSLRFHGSKMQGDWSLLKLEDAEDSWVLVRDEQIESRPAVEGEIDLSLENILQVADYDNAIRPMLASLTDLPFDRGGWILEPKFSGIRALAYVLNGTVKLYSRRGLDLTHRFPDLAASLAKQDSDMIIDGEIVALTAEGRPSFQLLQQRSGLISPEGFARQNREIPIQFYAFDMIATGQHSIINLPLSERKSILKKKFVRFSNLRLVDNLSGDGVKAFNTCINYGLEGLMAKRLDSTYQVGHRSKDWLKIKAIHSSEFVICGFTEGHGSRKSSFGSLVLGYPENGQKKLTYAGCVGSGFDENELEMLAGLMKSLVTSTCPLTDKPPVKATWLKPQLVAEVKYTELTNDHLLRIPVYLNLRPDISPSETGFFS
jgi:bifunctional non-homologous end joining protein LigD